MADIIQQDYLTNERHSQHSKDKIADYINEGFMTVAWLAKNIRDLNLDGIEGIAYCVKSDFSIGREVRALNWEWKSLPDLLEINLVSPKLEHLPEALKNIRHLNSIAPSPCLPNTLHCQFMDFPVEISVLDRKRFALKQFTECVARMLGDLGKKEPIEKAFNSLWDGSDIDNYYNGEKENDKYARAFVRFLDLGCIRRGVGRFSISFPSEGIDRPVSVNFEDGNECDSAFKLAFLTCDQYPLLLRFGVLSEDADIRDLAFMAHTGVYDTQMRHVRDMFSNLQH